MKKTIVIFLGLWVCLSASAIVTVTDFRLKNIEGKITSLDDFKAFKGVILTFLTTDCPVVQLYEPRIISLSAKYKSSFPLIAINPVDNIDVMKKVAKERGYNFNYACDETQGIARAYGIKSTTHTFVFVNTPQGPKIIYEGSIDDDYWGKSVETNYVENAINNWLTKGSVDIARTKAIGCPVTYR